MRIPLSKKTLLVVAFESESSESEKGVIANIIASNESVKDFQLIISSSPYKK